MKKSNFRRVLVADCGHNILVVGIPHEAKAEEIMHLAYCKRRWYEYCNYCMALGLTNKKLELTNWKNVSVGHQETQAYIENPETFGNNDEATLFHPDNPNESCINTIHTVVNFNDRDKYQQYA